MGSKSRALKRKNSRHKPRFRGRKRALEAAERVQASQKSATAIKEEPLPSPPPQASHAAQASQATEIKEEPCSSRPAQASKATQWTPKSAGLQQKPLQRTPTRNEKVSKYFEEAKKHFGEEGSSFSVDFSESPGGTLRVHFEKKQKAPMENQVYFEAKHQEKRVSFDSQTEFIPKSC